MEGVVRNPRRWIVGVWRKRLGPGRNPDRFDGRRSTTYELWRSGERRNRIWLRDFSGLLARKPSVELLSRSGSEGKTRKENGFEHETAVEPTHETNPWEKHRNDPEIHLQHGSYGLPWTCDGDGGPSAVCAG